MSSSPAAPAPAKSPSPPASSARASALIALAILISRVLGLARETVFAHYLGNSLAAGAFKAALRIPNFLQNLFGEGVLSASFIPVYTKLRSEGRDDEARKLAGVVGSFIAVGVSVLVLIGVGLSPLLVDLIAPGFEGDLRELTVQIVRILFPGVGLLVLSAWCLGILNSHRKFFVSYIAPVFWNLAMIATLVIYGPSSTPNDLALALAWAAVVGSCLQLGIQLPFVFRHGGRIRVSLDRSLTSAHTVFKNFVPVLLSRGVVQVSAFLDEIVSSFLGHAAVASIAYAQTLYLLPVSLFGMAVAAAELPEMSEAATAGSEAKARLVARIQGGMRRIAFFVLPSAIAFIALGGFIIRLIFQSGRFNAEDTLYVWWILIALAIGLLASTWSRLLSSSFFALGDTRTPLKLALARVITALSFGLLFAFPLRAQASALIELALGFIPTLRRPQFAEVDLALGAVGLSLGGAISAWLEFTLLRHALGKRIGRIEVSLRHTAKILGASLIAAVGAWVLHSFLPAFLPESLHRTRASALLPLVGYGAIYLALAYTIGIDEVSAITRRFKR